MLFPLYLCISHKFQMDLPETTDHACYHHIQDNKLLQFHLLLGQSEIIIC